MITHATVLAAPPAENTARHPAIRLVQDARQRVRMIAPEVAKADVAEVALARSFFKDRRGEQYGNYSSLCNKLRFKH